MAYRLTRGSVSIIRKDAAGVKEAEAKGFILDGECDADGKLLPPRPVEADQPKKAKVAK